MKIRSIPGMLLLLCAGCVTQDVCDGDNQSYLAASFVTTTSGEPADTLVENLYVYGIRDGIPGEVLAEYDSVSAQRINLPLDPGQNKTEFVILAGDKRDTITILHHSDAYLISYNCGFAARFTIEDFTHRGNLIVDYEIVKTTVDAENVNNEDHLHLYL